MSNNMLQSNTQQLTTSVEVHDISVSDRHDLDAAFAFIVLWDPEKGIIIFSSVDRNIRPSVPSSPSNHDFPHSSISDLESMHRVPTVSNSISIRSSTSCYGALRSRHNTLFSRPTPPLDCQYIRGASQTSSTLGGLDVYMKGAALSATHIHRPVYSILNFEEFHFPELISKTSEEVDHIAHLGVSKELDISKYEKCGLGGHGLNPPDDWATAEWPCEPEDITSTATIPKARTGRRLKKKRPAADTPNTLCQVFHPGKLFSAMRNRSSVSPHDYDWVIVETL